jgi:hypothetical protein
MTSASEPKLTHKHEVQEYNRGLKFGKAPGPNGTTKRALKHLSKLGVSLLVHILKAVLRSHHFPSVLKQARVISILQPGKDPAQLSSNRPINLLDTIGSLFQRILLTRIINEVGECLLLRDE